MSMQDWAKRLDGFLEFNGSEILTGPGKISHEQAKLHAETEFEKYRIVQDRLFESDFDKSIKALMDGKKTSDCPSLPGIVLINRQNSGVFLGVCTHGIER